jgi:hypothetical protein
VLAPTSVAYAVLIKVAHVRAQLRQKVWAAHTERLGACNPCQQQPKVGGEARAAWRGDRIRLG